MRFVIEAPEGQARAASRAVNAILETFEEGASTHCRRVTPLEGPVRGVVEHHYRLDVTVEVRFV